jgi:cytochrome c oxidase subunit IV
MRNSPSSSDFDPEVAHATRRGVRVRMFAVIYIISVIVTLLSAFALRQLLRWTLT